MLRKSLGKTTDEWMLQFIQECRERKQGAVRMEEVASYILDNQLLEVRPETAHRILTRRLKRAARQKRILDGRNRKVRSLIPAKYESQDENGNKYIDVVWDYLHEMDIAHALIAFDQRDKNIEKQKRAATRDLESFLEFNPNAAGHEEQFKFGFMTEEPMPQVEQLIKESEIKPATNAIRTSRPR